MHQVLQLPSAEGRGGEYDLFVRAPAGMSLAEALDTINAEVKRVNEEDKRNGDACDDGLCVEDSLKACLIGKGFEFFKPAQTLCWDEVPR